MSKHMTKYNAADLLEHLSSKGLVTNQDLADFVISQQQEKELPLYLRALLGIGALIASLCFTSFLSIVDIINYKHELGLIIWGLIFVASAIGLKSITCRDNTVKHSFFMQSSFAAMVIGKSLFVFGMSQILDPSWGVTLALLVITVLTYHIYRMSIDRFLSSFAILFSILVNILQDQDISGSRELLFNGFFVFQFVSAAILLMHGKIKYDYVPLTYAFVFSICASVLFLTSHVKFDYWKHRELIYSVFINVVLTSGLIALFYWSVGGAKKLLVSTGAVLLGLISAPGILLTIGLMVLGYTKHEKPLIIVGALLMPVFLFLYYYNLDISLLQKSGVLIGSGVVLLASRFYLQHWDKGGRSCVQK